MGYPLRLELTQDYLLVKLANHYEALLGKGNNSVLAKRKKES